MSLKVVLPVSFCAIVVIVLAAVGVSVNQEEAPMSLWMAIPSALCIVLGAVAALLIAGVFIIAGGIWVMDRIDDYLGKGVMDSLFNVVLGIFLFIMFCVFWYGAVAWLMGWE